MHKTVKLGEVRYRNQVKHGKPEVLSIYTKF